LAALGLAEGAWPTIELNQSRSVNIVGGDPPPLPPKAGVSGMGGMGDQQRDGRLIGRKRTAGRAKEFSVVLRHRPRGIAVCSSNDSNRSSASQNPWREAKT
jgi:hypothetical protein